MIDLHTHTFLSDGVLSPSEMARRAEVAGCEAIAFTDHVDHSNIDFVLEAIGRVAPVLTEHLGLFVIKGVELTYVPKKLLGDMVSYARDKGAEIVVVHGESPVEPVESGTNRAAIEACCDILAHPGRISEEDAALAAEKGVLLEITARAGHNSTNAHVLSTALRTGAKMVLNTDAHMPEDMLTFSRREDILKSLTDEQAVIDSILGNSRDVVERLRAKRDKR